MKRKPADIKYSTTHTWVRLEGTNKVMLGITDHLLKDGENIVSITLPKVGDSVDEGMSLGEIESDDNVVSIISPLNGKVEEVNKEILKNPGLVLEEPYDEGWLIKVKLQDASDIDSFMSHREYEDSFSEEEEAAKSDFIEEDEEDAI